jgi:hypothetical protein
LFPHLVAPPWIWSPTSQAFRCFTAISSITWILVSRRYFATPEHCAACKSALRRFPGSRGLSIRAVSSRRLSARSYVNERPDRNSTSCPGKFLSASPWPLKKILFVSNERRLSGFDYITVTDSKWLAADGLPTGRLGNASQATLGPTSPRAPGVFAANALVRIRFADVLIN